MEKLLYATIEIGSNRKLTLLGGGPLVRDLCLWAQKHDYHVSVITAPRHASAVSDGISLADFLSKNEIPHLVTESINTQAVREFVGDPSDTFFLALGAAWIFKQEAIDEIFGGCLMNLHGARLPQNRGAGGFSWQIMTGNKLGFCVMHSVDEGLDTGDIVFSEEFLYPPSCRTSADYHSYYIEKNFAFVTKILAETRHAAKKTRALPQTEYLSSYWPRLHTATNGWIDWKWSAQDIERFICAFDDPYAGAQTGWNGVKVHIKKAALNLQDGAFHPFQAGIVYRKSDNWLCVASIGGGLVIESVEDEEGNSLFDKIRLGDRLSTPLEKLHDMQQRIIFTPNGVKESASATLSAATD